MTLCSTTTLASIGTIFTLTIEASSTAADCMFPDAWFYTCCHALPCPAAHAMNSRICSLACMRPTSGPKRGAL
jgi:hypothetical protein